MKKEKYGFVYIWRDRKHNRYYIGSHWGTEDDGYICSSRMMRQAYRRRPHDFKRRIIQKTHGDRSELYEAENKWLNFAEKNKDRYYNMLFTTQHWVAYPENVKSIREKISHKTKEALARPEVREKLDKHYDSIRDTKQPQELVEKRRQSMIETMAEKFPVENRYTPLSEEERFEYYSQKGKNTWSNRSEEQLREVGNKISNSLKGKKNRLGQSNTEEHRKKISDAQFDKPGVGVMVEGTYYHSVAKASRESNIPIATIHRRLKSHKYKEYYRLARYD